MNPSSLKQRKVSRMPAQRTKKLTKSYVMLASHKVPALVSVQVEAEKLRWD